MRVSKNNRMGQNKRLSNAKVSVSKLRIEDEVVVITGRDRGKRGKILALDLKRKRALVQGIHLVKKYSRPSQENPKPTEIKVEQPIALSNIMYYDKKNKKGRRLTYQVDQDNKNTSVKTRAMKIFSEKIKEVIETPKRKKDS